GTSRHSICVGSSSAGVGGGTNRVPTRRLVRQEWVTAEATANELRATAGGLASVLRRADRGRAGRPRRVRRARHRRGPRALTRGPVGGRRYRPPLAGCSTRCAITSSQLAFGPLARGSF